MIRFTQGNLLEAGTDALVNTVNTVGVMGKGIALMFKEAFPENFQAYEVACKAGAVTIGTMFVIERHALVGPKWIINFPTKRHWRNPSQIAWIIDGLADLVRVLRVHDIRSVALPPLGAGNGGLAWPRVREVIEAALGELDLDVVVYEPTSAYQNVAKRAGVETLTPARALIAELIRRYWVLGMECSLLEIQKLAWFLERGVILTQAPNAFDFRFVADKYGPYSNRLSHLLDGLDGSYLHCDKRIGDAGPLDVISFDSEKADRVSAYLTSPDAKPFAAALKITGRVIEGFESPFGMELLATVDWLRCRDNRTTLDGVKAGLASWPAGKEAARRKVRIFNDDVIRLALEHLDAKLVV